MGPLLAGAQIDRPGRRAKQPIISVPLVDSCGQAAVGPRKAKRGGHGLRAGDGVTVPGLVAFGGSCAAYLAGIVEGAERVVRPPVRPLPDVPSIPGRDVA